MAIDSTTTVVREAPEIEAYKIGLLESAKELADQRIEIPKQMVAEMSDLQVTAADIAEAGIGGYQPYLQEAGYTLGDAQTALEATMTTAAPYQQEAGQLMRTAAGGIPQSINEAQAGIQGAIDYGAGATQEATGDLRAASQGARTAALAGQTAAGEASGQIPGVLQSAQAGTSSAGLAALDAARQSQISSGQAIAGARGITGEASQALQRAGAFGTQTAQQGIAGLAGTTAAYDPASAGAYMNQYEDAAVQQALADIQRAGDIQQLSSDAQAVSAGAFGGSRQGIADAELSRNILEQQGRTAAGMRQQGFDTASQLSQKAFEQQQGRGLQAAQLTGALGAQGAQSGITAAQAAGQLGLSAEQLAAATAQKGGQLGLSAAELGGQLSTQMGQLGLSASSTQADIAQRAAQLGISAEQLAGQLASQAGSLGQNQAQLGMTGAQQAGAFGMQGAELQGRIGEGIGNLGTNYGQLNIAQGEGLSQLGLRQGALGELGQNLQQKEAGFLFDVGKQQQAQQQAGLEAARQNELAQKYEEYQRVGFLSDIYKGAPTTQQSITSATAPSTSPAQQVLGLGVAGLSAAAGARKAGIL